eukprot:TRINITY_DN5265_c0_g2_i10.p1 TRINITY_DN5265_c0_g2~~TRINITY_DN5265_c0_g2_i10.p1  ORF type:complete len:148 (-),score=33.77 TRINITY_DN5265_c0_g2_i10:50-493(-)
MVEENRDIIHLYNRLVSHHRTQKQLCQRLQYYHLVDYSRRTEKQETLVWFLDGKVHDQDKAVLKEVARYKGEGLNFGVCVYAQFPGQKYSVSCGDEGIDYWHIQRQIESDEIKFGRKEILEEDEHYISELPISWVFVEKKMLTTLDQ